MSSDEAAFIEPALLSDRLSRNTKGLLISIALILVSATVSVIGTLQDDFIVRTIGIVIASICAIAFFIFFLFNLLSIRKLARTEEQLVPLVNKIYISLFSAFFLSLTGAVNSAGNFLYAANVYFISRITGMLAIIAFMLFFFYTEKLFQKLTELGKITDERKRRYNPTFTMVLLLILIVIDTFIRFFVFSNNSVTLTYIILSCLFVLVSYTCFEMFNIATNWEMIDYKFNSKYAQLPPGDYEEKLKTDTLLLISSFSLSVLLSMIIVVSYLISGSAYFSFLGGIFYSSYTVIGVLIIIFLISLIRTAINYQKFSNLSHKTSNYGIIIIISMIIGFAVIMTGFFYNSAYFGAYMFMRDGQLISRILMIIGLCLFSFGTLLVNIVINDLKTINKKLRINWTSSIFPMVSFSSAIILAIETIVRRIMWKNFDSLPSESTSSKARRFVAETIGSGYIYAALFTIILVVMIYGFIQFKKEILIVVPNYGKIPVKIKESETQVQQQAVYLPPKVAEEVPEDVRETIVRGTKCKKCGAKLLKRYRFCPDCGVKFQEEATKALPKATYCVMCGEKLSEKYRFCPTCGSMLE